MTIRLQIDRLVWDAWNVEHIAKHDGAPEEAEEVIAGDPAVRVTYKQRYQLIGPTLSNRIFGTTSEPEGAAALRRAEGAIIHMNKAKPTVDLGYPTEAHGRIPSFKDIEEEAAFWDTHDVTDYLDESKPAEIAVGPELAEKLTLRLERADRDELILRARQMGIGPSTLARIWIKERLRQEPGAPVPSHS